MTRRIALALILTATSAQAQQFEGVITAAMRGENATVAYSIKGDKLRMDMTTGSGMQAATIVDRGAKKLYMLLVPQRMYMERDMEDVVPQGGRVRDEKTGDFSWTGTHQTIAGIRCDDGVVTDREGNKLDMCIARGITFFGGASAVGRGRAPDWQSRVQGGFPLKVQHRGDPAPIMEVTKVEEKSLSSDLFTPPEGWQKMTLPMGRP